MTTSSLTVSPTGSPSLTTRDELVRLAGTLRATGSEVFIPILALSERLGLRVQLRFSAAPAKAVATLEYEALPPQISLFRRGPAGATRSLLPPDEHLLTPRDRFSIAHELGHWVALQRLGIRPATTGSREYWQHESIVDAFAGALLVSDEVVFGWLRDVPAGGIVALSLVKSLALAARVSLEVVAHAICRQRKGVGFLKVREATAKDGSLVLQVAFAASGDGLVLAPIHKHVRDPQLLQLLHRQPVGEGILDRAEAATPEDPDLVTRLAWISSSRNRRPAEYWVSLSASRIRQMPLAGG
jgi:hypothetical protein